MYLNCPSYAHFHNASDVYSALLSEFMFEYSIVFSSDRGENMQRIEETTTNRML
jgi:hypothetical protein